MKYKLEYSFSVPLPMPTIYGSRRLVNFSHTFSARSNKKAIEIARAYLNEQKKKEHIHNGGRLAKNVLSVILPILSKNHTVLVNDYN